MSEASGYGDIPTECGGSRGHPKGAAGPEGWSRDPTHEVGITHTLEHMSESINNTIQTELPQKWDDWPLREAPRGVAVTYTALV